MKAQCPCVRGQGRIPNPTCEECHGSGYIEVFLPEEDGVEAVWIGRCPLCGTKNGCHIQLKGKPQPQPDPYWRCINENCSRPQVELVKAKE